MFTAALISIQLAVSLIVAVIYFAIRLDRLEKRIKVEQKKASTQDLTLNVNATGNAATVIDGLHRSADELLMKLREIDTYVKTSKNINDPRESKNER